jgi:hypothetical protein
MIVDTLVDGQLLSKLDMLVGQKLSGSGVLVIDIA